MSCRRVSRYFDGVGIEQVQELDLLAGFLLEGGDDLRDRLVLLRVEPFLPPHHEVGGLRAERRQHERRGEKNRKRADA